MANAMETLSNSEKWHVLVQAAKQALEAQGFTMQRVPGRGLSNIWTIEKDGKSQVASIRTTQDRWFAFPPLNGGTGWKTLDDAEIVIVAAVDDREDPENAEVYMFPADEVRKRFDAAYAARIEQGRSVRDNFGMWVGLDLDTRTNVVSVGSGIAEQYKALATYPIKDLLVDKAEPSADDAALIDEAAESEQFTTIAEVMAWARERVADLAGVEVETVRLDLKMEY